MKNTKASTSFIILNIFLFVGLFIITVIFWITDLDINTIKVFYLESGEWTGRANGYYSFFYFPMNAIIFSIPLMIGFPILLMSFSKRDFFKKIRNYRNHSLLMILGTMLGAGLFNSVILKAIFARPRPSAYFDGNLVFYRPFEIATEYWRQLDMSFPSGHVSIAFVLLVFFFAFRYAPNLWQKLLKWGVGVVLPIFAGVSMILSRMSFGDHYLSDGIWAGAFTYYFVLGLYFLLKIPEKNKIIEANNKIDNVISISSKDIMIIAFSILVPVIFAGYFILQFNGLTGI